MKKEILFAILLLVSTNANISYAQKSSILDKVKFGGNFGFTTGSRTFIEVSPVAAYKINEKLLAGVSIDYQYFKINNTDISTNIWGGSVFGRYYAFRGSFLQIQYENISYRLNNNPRINYATYLVGGGFSYPINDKLEINITVLYDLNNNSPNSPYTSPIRTNIGVLF